jgi:signal transduction histidine kinase
MPISGADGPSGTFVVAIFMDSQRSQVSDVVRTGAIVYGSTFIGASILAWFAAGRVLRPIRLLTNTARSITDDNWSERIPVHGDDEIAELTHTFNDMLDRLESAFATQRRFIDDAGHELRTPITIIRGHLELLDDDPVEREETMRLVMDELDRMARIVDDLLLLARAEQPDFLELRPLDVGELTEEVVAKAGALAPRAWRVGETAHIVMMGDRQRLTQALMNLARNAAEHTDHGTSIVVGSRAAGNTVRLWVQDAGTGIPLSEQAAIFDRFARGRASSQRQGSAGLGLAIVKAIIDAHGGRVELESAAGQGSTFTLVLPIGGPAKGDA